MIACSLFTNCMEIYPNPRKNCPIIVTKMRIFRSHAISVILKKTKKQFFNFLKDNLDYLGILKN